MDKDERRRLAEQVAWLKQRGDQARHVLHVRSAAASHTQAAREHLRQRLLTCALEQRQMLLLPLDVVGDALALEHLFAERALPPLSSSDRDALSVGSQEVQAVLLSAERLVKHRSLFLSKTKRSTAEAAAREVAQWYDRAQAEGLGAQLDAVMSARSDATPSVAEVAQEVVGLDAAVIPGDLVRSAWFGRDAVARVRAFKQEVEERIQALGSEIRDADVERTLAEMPINALKQSTSGRLRLGAIEDAGLTTVQSVLDFGPRLSVISGVGEQTARQTWAAAETMRSMLRRETPLRIDVKRRDYSTSRLLTELWKWGTTSAMLRRIDDHQDVLDGLDQLLTHGAAVNGTWVTHLVTTSQANADRITRALSELRAWESAVVELSSPPMDSWKAFLARPADYLGWLNLLGFQTEDEGAAEGNLSSGLIEKVRAQDLDTRLLRGVSLRGYQDFGARFALAQRKVVIGDEMGLGKTIEALAMVAHLHAKGATHSIVVCPAAVLSNWSREVGRRSELEVFALHGADRGDRLQRWARRGGIAVTTFATLKSLRDGLSALPEIHAVVVDEAHNIKNPRAQRTVDSRALIDRSEHALLLTGTPIENKLQEFANLVSYLQPELLDALAESTPGAFPKVIAPAYLRRNQEDVLKELPERIDVEEWIPMSTKDQDVYEAAVHEGNFMAMRRAVLMTGQSSAKMRRLVELTAEARANHRKVIVFSYFRDVLDEVMAALSGDVFGPLTGSVPARDRQRLVDAFTAAPAGAVLVSQIAAGGVGLNIQAGSVVVICEPQVKPSMETQAVARAHRMGQTEVVQVHRLLSDEGVDRRMREILEEKQRLFDEFARVSHTADSAPEAVDVSESELAREVITAERERLARRDQMAHTSSH